MRINGVLRYLGRPARSGRHSGLRGLGDVSERGANPGTTLQGSERERERRATGGVAALADRRVIGTARALGGVRAR